MKMGNDTLYYTFASRTVHILPSILILQISHYLNPTEVVELPALLSIYKARLGLSFPVPGRKGLPDAVPGLAGDELRLTSKYPFPPLSGAKCQSASALSRIGDAGGEEVLVLLRKSGGVSIHAITSSSFFSGASEIPLRAASE